MLVSLLHTSADAIINTCSSWPDSLFAELIMSLSHDCPNPSHPKGRYKIKEWMDEETISGSVFAQEEYTA
jgi:hypothetical protein